MKRNKLIQTLCYIVICTTFYSCGCGPQFLYNWRPKPWEHRFDAQNKTRLYSKINLNGYYVTENTPNQGEYFSIMFYNNGLCVSTNTRILFLKTI